MLQQITASDIPWIVDFMDKHYSPAYAYLWEDQGEWYVQNMYSQEKLTEEFLNKAAEFYQVIHEGNLIGYCKLIKEKCPPGYENQRCFYLQRLYLDTNYQGRGIGGRLMNQLIERTKQEGYDLIWLETMEIGASKRFYERLDFHEVDKIRLPFPGMIEKNRGLLTFIRQLS